MLWKDIIYEVRRLQQHNGKDSKESYQNNPVARIITPEWYHADSIEIFDGIDIVWDNLERLDLVNNMADGLNEIKIDRLANDGFEASFCSWYQSFHYSPRTKWGIHIRYTSWLEIAALLNQSCPNLVSNPIGSTKAAFLYLFIHSIFHYIAECAASTIEISLQNPYIYTNYVSNIYENVFNSHDCLEESLANSYLLSRSDACHIERGYLEKTLLKQGPGYNDFTKYAEPNFSYGTRKLISQIRSGKLSPPSEPPAEHIMNIFNSGDYPHNDSVPIWLHTKPRALHDRR